MVIFTLWYWMLKLKVKIGIFLSMVDKQETPYAIPIYRVLSYPVITMNLCINFSLPFFIGSCMSKGYTGCCENGDCRGGELSDCCCDEL